MKFRRVAYGFMKIAYTFCGFHVTADIAEINTQRNNVHLQYSIHIHVQSQLLPLVYFSGMIPMLSVRTMIKMLECLRNSYKVAVEFDSRPGLKFLIQKVARTEVAVNLYKQAGASMVFFIHSLLQICASVPDLSKVKVKSLSYSNHQNLLDICYHDTRHCSNIARVLSSPDLFIQLLKAICDELCQTYVDILSDETSSRVDSMAEQQVFFLIAQPDDISDIVKKRKKDQTENLISKPAVPGLDFMSSAVQGPDLVSSAVQGPNFMSSVVPLQGEHFLIYLIFIRKY